MKTPNNPLPILQELTELVTPYHKFLLRKWINDSLKRYLKASKEIDPNKKIKYLSQALKRVTSGFELAGRLYNLDELGNLSNRLKSDNILKELLPLFFESYRPTRLLSKRIKPVKKEGVEYIPISVFQDLYDLFCEEFNYVGMPLGFKSMDARRLNRPINGLAYQINFDTNIKDNI